MSWTHTLSFSKDISHTTPEGLALTFRSFGAFFVVFYLSFICSEFLGSLSADFSFSHIYNSVLFSSIAFVTLLLVSYWSVMANINLARQKMAFSLLRVDASEERSDCVTAQCTVRC